MRTIESIVCGIVTDLPVSNSSGSDPVTNPVIKTASPGSRIDIGGTIEDAAGNLINGATIQIILAGGVLGTPIVTDGTWVAWAEDPTKMIIVFGAKGFKNKSILFTDLMNNGKVVLEPGTEIPWLIIAMVVAALLLLRQKSGKVGKVESGEVLTIFIILGGIVGVTVIVKVLKTLGLWGDPSASEQSNPQSAFKPAYYQQFSTFSYVIDTQTAKDYASTIYNAFHLFTDDYEQIMGVFSQCKTKANVSFIAGWFYNLYQTDLLSFLTNGGGILPWDGLSSTHLQTILDYVSKLPSN